MLMESRLRLLRGILSLRKSWEASWGDLADAKNQHPSKLTHQSWVMVDPIMFGVELFKGTLKLYQSGLRIRFLLRGCASYWILLGNANTTQSDECRTGDLTKHSDTCDIYTPETPPALLKIFANAYIEHHLQDIIDLAMATLKFFDIPCAMWAEHALTAGIAYVALQERRPNVQCISDWNRMEYLSSSACKPSDVRPAGDDTEFLNTLSQLAPAFGIVIAVQVKDENASYLIHAQDRVVGIGYERGTFSGDACLAVMKLITNEHRSRQETVLVT
ncbi:hypothetical protein BD779DRAFT_1478300 [Infundibulicybe gibba]|nr:hypothetical protein BD779DRAFT_1478300 [Infundibulicybe gibba]